MTTDSGCHFEPSAWPYAFNPSRTHKQSQCPDCGLWTVWTSKKREEVFNMCKELRSDWPNPKEAAGRGDRA